MDVFSEVAPYWRYDEPPPMDKVLSLLTKGGKQVVGLWSGKFGEQYIAWAGLIKRDKDKERTLGII
jgi:hypothetical protein